MIQARRINSFEEVKALYAGSDSDIPFLAKSWLETLLHNQRGLALPGEFLLIGFFDGDTAVGFVPLTVVQTRIGRFLPCKVIRFPQATYSDYCDIVTAHGWRQRVVESLAGFLAENKGLWDLAWLTEIPQWSLTNDLLLPALHKARLHHYTKTGSTCYRISLPATWDEYVHGHGKSGQKNFRYYSNKLKDKGTVAFGAADALNISDSLVAFFTLHRKRWQSEGKPGVFGSETVRACFEETLREMFDAGILRLLYIRVNEKYVATSVRFAGGDTLYGWLTGFDPEWSDYRLGTQLHMHTMKYAIENGYKVYDLTRGDHSYKIGLGAETVPNREYLLSHSRCSLAMFRLTETLSGLLKRNGTREKN